MSSSHAASIRSSARCPSAIPTWPAQPTAIAPPITSAQSAGGYRRGRTGHSAQAAMAAKPAKKMPDRTFAALAARSVRATKG